MLVAGGRKDNKAVPSVLMEPKVARRPWAPRTALEFAIKTCYVLDSRKNIFLSLNIFRRPWKSLLFLKFFI